MSITFPSPPTQPENSSDIPEYLNDYHPSREDVLEARHFFLRFMPLKLVNAILEEARYMPCLVMHNRESHILHSSVDRNDASWHYLIMPPIPPLPKDEDGEDVPMNIREVIFWFKSRDQGWGGDYGLTGLYSGSWTWFEACIYRRLPGDVSEDLRADIERNNIMAPKKEDLQAARIERVTDHASGSDIWNVQRNVRASSTVKLHRVRWTTDEESNTEEFLTSMDIDYSTKSGAGAGKGFVSSLRAGRQIAIISRARFPRWVNHVIEAAVEVYFSV
ncbi:hypothetical protein BDQ17DRAFT_1254219 [Cyathus striatus]|nr:hypothetical protein BDQ17DRAFT_1254219 [Cyathus striatus]